ncbi:MAG: aminopeptidase family protein P, partial [Bacteroidota bacterium]
ELELKYAGASRQKKLKQIRQRMKQQGVDFHLISTLDDIAWIFNLRGKDIAFNPVFMAYALIGMEIAYIFIDPAKISEALKTKLRNEGILLKEYKGIDRMLRRLPKGQKILVDYNRLNIALYNELPKKQIVEGRTISTPLKAIKNETEIKNISIAMRKDGVALTRLFRWLEKTVKKQAVSEADVAKQLDYYRSEQGDYFGESFPAIVGYGANGAIVHYRPEPGKCAMIEAHGILLLDSGGQYWQGTTDVTRTVALGKVTAQQKKHFTLVLKGNIALASLRFPKGTRGNQMEIMARQYLWQAGLNYGHGTGHGVGFFLNVHEGPQALGSGATAKAATPFEVGMLTSNEPGFYLPGEYGIRIENLELTVFDQQTDFGDFYRFETMTLFPIDRRLIVPDLLDAPSRAWLDAYHSEVLDKIGPRVSDTA